MSRNNAEAITFVKRMVSGFCADFPPSGDTQKLYVEKLSGHVLTPEQWDQALDALIMRHPQKGLPPLAMIYTAIGEVQARHDTASRRGKAIFRLAGYEYALIVKREHGEDGEYWAIAGVTAKSHGETVELQKFIGMEARDRIALIPGAQFVGFFPDDPGRVWYGEMPTAQERAEIVAKTKQLMAARHANANAGDKPLDGDGKWIAMESVRSGYWPEQTTERARQVIAAVMAENPEAA